MSSNERELKTVMHPVKMRTLKVKNIQQIAPHLKRITFSGEELADFTSLSPDDHVKVFFPYPGEETPVLPVMTPEGLKVPEGSRPAIMRDYTPRRYDSEAKELDIEFFLHGSGPGSQWAEQARIGQTLTVGGPRGSKIVPYNFDWYLMIGDESAIPSFARRLQELPKNSRSLLIVEVENESDKIDFVHEGLVEVFWIFRKGDAPGKSERLKTQLERMRFPVGDYFAWVALEKSCAFELKEFLLHIKGAQEEWIKATGYWKILL
ncbi:NADPH-dependent ferric siderophore reductase [Bdellovibrio bacteriovorus]|uniref:NADPH-dependent ferric siderophore reductase n=1 Tax=Bdellovibrio bacteriovorus TaxID=959 RepID=A0A162G758_BDEBC|nr:siderophore-interacting protein [Bdellovibrio bacteriovorus]KYG65162.1 NADPH-dependent ferric siderophore reductase [Bdellovibrio bacteriovorus]